MSDQRYTQGQQSLQAVPKDKSRGQMLLTPPAKKLRMSRRKVEH